MLYDLQSFKIHLRGLRFLFEPVGTPPDFFSDLAALRATSILDSRICFFLPLLDVVILQGGTSDLFHERLFVSQSALLETSESEK